MAAPAPVPTFADFVAQFPEFGEIAPAVVNGALVRASRHVDPRVWGAKAVDGVMYKAGHFLNLSPMGMNTRLTAKFFAENGTTTYGAEFERMLQEVGGGFAVAGRR